MKRLAYIDWMRGLACVLMFQTHCYDSWLTADAKKTEFFRYSQMGGTLPAPLFIFLAGISVALVTERLRGKGAERGAIAKQIMWRGAEVFGLGILFRVQEFILGIPISPWTDLLRVDVLNILGISMILMGALCWAAGSRTAGALRSRNLATAVTAAAAVALATPLLWTSWRPRFLPWEMESYVNGVHIFDKPQVWLFPIFPWAAFAFVGLAVGLWMFTDYAKRRGDWNFLLIGATGMGMFAAALLLDRWGVNVYAVYDYWHTSPNFFLARSGVMVTILSAAYAWCRWGWQQTGFSPVEQLGRTSLLVYWVHIEFVYGRLSILPKGKCGIAAATAGMVAIFLAMLGLSVARTRWSSRRELLG
ncbi:MAG TPA: heparan-alpha-glucosaminide N-acetyltransferase domain-containing protein [Candidatus Acidoferrum sp.]